MITDAIVLAGGLGTRLRDTVPGVPKPLAPVGGRPFLDLLLQQLGTIPTLKRVILAIGHQASQIIEHYRDPRKFGSFEITFSIEHKPLGTGGALRQALIHTCESNILVLNGDSFLAIDWASFTQTHSTHEGIATIATVHQTDISRYGELILNRRSKRITDFREKEGLVKAGFINAGVYLFRARVKKHLPPANVFSIEQDLFPSLLREGLYAHEVQGKFIDIGTKESYALAQHILTEVSEQQHV